MRVLVTGAAGFVGSNLVDRLLAEGHEVVGYDNLSTGQERFLETARANARFSMVRGDILAPAELAPAMRGIDMVFHLAANADVRFGLQHPRTDLDQNTIGTFNVLEAMRQHDVRRIAFSSTGSVYGEPTIFPTPEDAPFPIQTSLYGASKAAGEALIQAYSEGFGVQGFIFRFVSILGERYTHGHVFDFVGALRADPGNLTVLGDGTQRKSYLYIQDCLDAIMLAVSQSTARLSILNLGTDEVCRVDDSIGWICEELGISPARHYTGGPRGWIGDSPLILLDCSRMHTLGWRPQVSIRDAIVRTVRYLLKEPWVFEQRARADPADGGRTGAA